MLTREPAVDVSTPSAANGPAKYPLRVENVIVLPQVKGGFDLMAADVTGHRLFVAAEDNNTVEVVDTVSGKPEHSIGGFRQPKGIAYVADSRKLYVSNKDDGMVDVLDSTTFSRLARVDFKSKANNVHFDPRSRTIYVGYGEGAIGTIMTIDDSRGPDVPLASYPKQFRLESDSPRIFVNVPVANHVAVIDRKQNRVIQIWPIREAKSNVPMALDEAHHRLMVACDPGQFIVLNTDTGQSVSSFKIKTAADGIHYDSVRHAVYVSCGEGYLQVIRQHGPDSYDLIETIPTVAGAGTSLFVPELDRLYLAVPQTKNRPAEIWVYQATASAQP